MYKAGIIGAAGYTGGELIRLLLQHPNVEIAFVHSNSQAGKLVSDTHDDLVGDTDLVFTDELDLSVEVLFLCMGHGEAKQWLEKNRVPDNTLLIDLSHDFRWKEGFVYGLPELNKVQIQQSKRIANPGCFATAIQLALLPLARMQLIQEEVHIHAITGSTGAGQSLQATSHFSWRSNNLSVYKAFEHQHLGEIGESLRTLQPNLSKALNFVPVRGDFARGIFASAYTNCDLNEKELNELYHDFYQAAPFTKVTKQNPHLKQVVNTNKCVVYVEKHGDKVFVISVIDNLLKGASGQAMENMNLALGINQCDGLALKASFFNRRDAGDAEFSLLTALTTFFNRRDRKGFSQRTQRGNQENHLILRIMVNFGDDFLTLTDLETRSARGIEAVCRSAFGGGLGRYESG